MKLRSLRLQGFKSFADRTTLEFREGVTAIVGSNGCGKSNVADAIRWVLGEQRASAVRGARMEEVIFGGTTRRRPVNLAEVSLLFSNEAGRVAIPQAEIEISRKVFREGGSEYALNRTTCRLRDIHTLLRDTGLGANAYSIIEGTMIETLLSDRAEERRMLFEEAAGVGRYKDSLRAAARRLEAAEADLARLGDLVTEVESKVRSLARQRRRAQRHGELRERKLALEVALARSELAALAEALAASERGLRALAEEETLARTARSAAEALGEERRLEAVELGQRRGALAGRLDEVRRRLDEREREVLVADERRSHVELRLQQLVRERAELVRRLGALTAERERLEEARRSARERLESLRGEVERRGEENAALRAALASCRQLHEAAAARAGQLAREIAAAEGERAALLGRQRELRERSARLEPREQQLAEELRQLDAQGARLEEAVAGARDRLAAAAALTRQAGAEIRALRQQEVEARERLRAAEDRLSRLASQVAAREALEASYEGFSPAVAAVMARRPRLPGVHGPLADFLAADATAAQALETYLGPLLQALVVADLAAARAVRRWFREEWQGGGSLLLLPCDAPALGAAAEPSLPLSATSPGAAWVRLLLADLCLAADADPLAEHSPGRARLSAGEVVDARGVIRLSEQRAGEGSEGILTRRASLLRLRAERDGARSDRDTRHAEREQLAAELTRAEERAQEAEELRRTLSAELHRLEEESAASGHHQRRLREDREETVRTASALRHAEAEAAGHLSLLETRLAEIAAAATSTGAEAEAARAELAELEARWEAAREGEAELRVEVARAEGELREAERRWSAARQGSASAESRMAAIAAEAEELRASLAGLSALREQAGAEIEALLHDRDREAAALRDLDARLEAAEKELHAVRERAQAQQRRETELAEERHRLELSAAELRSRTERARERLEAEWGRSWEALLAAARPPEGGEPQGWKEELRQCRAQLEALGPVNLLAVEEHDEEERRLAFLVEQRDDLTRARDDLAAASRQINRTAREVFLSTFATIRQNFQRTFHSLFQGGECDIWLAEPDDPLESPVEIQASPLGKRTQRIHLLSGGERTLTALALLFALYLVKPSPFCVLDEVDAPLDESNVGRFLQLLQDFKAETQFIVITHNPRTMEAADWIYGVTMQEPGVSSIVGVELQGASVREDRVA